MNTTKHESHSAVAGQVDCRVRPRAWLVEDESDNAARTYIAVQDEDDARQMAPDDAPPIPLYDRGQIEAPLRAKIETLLRGITDARSLIDPIWRHRMGAEQVREHVQRGLRCIDSAVTDCQFTGPTRLSGP